MGMQRRSVRQRTLVPVLALYWRAKGNKAPGLQKSDLVRVECVDLELRAKQLDTRRQLDEYDRSREPEIKGNIPYCFFPGRREEIPLNLAEISGFYTHASRDLPQRKSPVLLFHRLAFFSNIVSKLHNVV